MLIRIGGEGSCSVVGGVTGTGCHFGGVLGSEEVVGGRISRPGWPGLWKRRVMEP